MVPAAQVTQWSQHAPWAQIDDIEQDLIISRALVDIFRLPHLRERLAFRGGTALHKLALAPATRYSEDIDLVLLVDEPLGPIIDALRGALSWLSPKPSRDRGFNLTLKFPFQAGSGAPRKLKVEANRGEEFSGPRTIETPFAMDSAFFKGDAVIRTYDIEELLATKLRATYQRQKGRDLYDLWYAVQQKPVDLAKTYALFTEYWARSERPPLKRAALAQRMAANHASNVFHGVIPLLRPGVVYDPNGAYAWFQNAILPLFPA